MLKTLNLINNHIVFIEYKTFEYNIHLIELYLEGNYIKSIDWVKFIPKVKAYDFPCPELVNENRCMENGNKTKQLAMRVKFNQSRCEFCNCKCKEINCGTECVGHFFNEVQNKFGCPKCKCVCPVIDCETPCKGIGVGIYGQRDEAGCYTTCRGCRKLKSKKFLNYRTYIDHRSYLGLFTCLYLP